MALIYITGVSATGKSTILKELLSRGYRVQDTDEDDYVSFYNKKTGEKTNRPRKITDRTEEWYSNNILKMSRPRIIKLVTESRGLTMFLCGSTFSDTSVWDLFDSSVCLTIDEKTLKHRLKTRTTNDWGKSPAEFKHVLKWREPWEKIYRDRGAIMIDSTQSLNKVVDKIIQASIK